MSRSRDLLLLFAAVAAVSSADARRIFKGPRGAPPPPAPTSELTVSWDAQPTQNADGTAMTPTDFRIWYGTAARMGGTVAYTSSVLAGSGAATSKVVTGLTPATTYCFAVSTITAAAEGNPSREVCADAP
jgi:hypothetical protein